MNPYAKAALRGGVSLAIVALGALVMGALINSRPAVEQKAESEQGVVVRTMKVTATRQKASVAAQGTVIPAQEVTLQPEVQGRVSERQSRARRSIQEG